jgi:hypothetical protein
MLEKKVFNNFWIYIVVSGDESHSIHEAHKGHKGYKGVFREWGYTCKRVILMIIL